jgi:hypothetical protein
VLQHSEFGFECAEILDIKRKATDYLQQGVVSNCVIRGLPSGFSSAHQRSVSFAEFTSADYLQVATALHTQPYLPARFPSQINPTLLALI